MWSEIMNTAYNYNAEYTSNTAFISDWTVLIMFKAIQMQLNTKRRFYKICCLISCIFMILVIWVSITFKIMNDWSIVCTGSFLGLTIWVGIFYVQKLLQMKWVEDCIDGHSAQTK